MSYQIASQIKRARNRADDASRESGLTYGIVVDTDDPQQNNRVRVACPSLGDDPNPTTMNVENIPWARLGSPLAGTMSQGYRGVNAQVQADTGYGFTGVPKVGTEVVVAIIDSNPGNRVVLCCVQDQSGGTAMPHGRFSSDGGYPDGPLALDGSQIQPLYDNLTAAFSGPFGGRDSFEYMSRGTDYTFAAFRGEAKNARQTNDDDEDVTITEADGREINYTQGYGADRIGAKNGTVVNDKKKYDPQTYSWTTPGFHAISMDDRVQNCRMRFRSTTGHQIILDDTNERIYISSFKGKNWVEMDAAGNIDIHSDTRISIHAAKDINLTSEETIRLSSKDVHIRAQNELRMYSNADMHMYSNANVRATTTAGMFIQTGSTFQVLATADAKITSTANVHVLAGTTAYMTGNSSVEILSSGNILETGAEVLQNAGPAASSADSATASQTKTAYHANRIPMHEPWPRVLTNKSKSDKDDSVIAIPVVYTGGSLSDFEYTSPSDPNIGRIEYGVSLNRNAKWHR